MKRRLTQSIAGLLLVCMAGSTIFGAANVTRKGTPKPEPTTSSTPSTGAPGKAPAKPSTPVAPSKAPVAPSTPVAPSKAPAAPSTPVAPSKAPATPSTPIAPKPPVAKPVVPSQTPGTPKPPVTKPVVPSQTPSTKPSTPVAPKPVVPSQTPSTKPGTPVAPKPSTCPNKPSTCPNKKPECPNKPKPFALDNFKVIQATLASCGVDEQELAAYIKQGKKLEDVLKAENISVRKFKKRVLKEYCRVINEAVKSGELTNEQGAQLKEAIKDTVKNWLPKK
nr:hypothetical protein [uncultured Cellulosilyticum sp.]